MRVNSTSLALFALALLALTIDHTAEAFVKGSVAPARPSFELNAAAKKKAKSKKKAAATKKTSAKKLVAESMRKPEFVALVAEKLDSTKAEADASIAAVVDTIVESVVAGKKVSLPGFGAFQLRARAARKGRNPQTGEEIDIKASNSPAFTAAKAFKELANE
mmetsp:Transcript_32585/g.50560  ORF Transcript_32585/g.50560 Transcript_32585/m.50560 type:complete len:162 (-) Transcript_32585:109-594(-)|eukprot:CAMPEP_0117030168 /NCGR_PEP_ID=MMETSP0472-20121206/21778_1 /TAXON_ID=693140 ORGANISM="Tiarina fusus, Strain LIS" /NCGR_SAMPLE_ID=MMETSP0472 /ASSEMBLY_ACC=CAM_ASM_000603 /LENGTH=161 /DNA_ID=CAMNT_0004738127 /DNA_START=135 /DNA_END=620 /DNA_ORIENTATION=-